MLSLEVNFFLTLRATQFFGIPGTDHLCQHITQCLGSLAHFLFLDQASYAEDEITLLFL